MKMNINSFLKDEKIKRIIVRCNSNFEQDKLIRFLYSVGYKWYGDINGSEFFWRVKYPVVYIYVHKDSKRITYTLSAENYFLFSDIIFRNKFLIIKETLNEKC